MANTYTLISSYTVGSGGAASISFSTIPNTYTDLLVFLSGRCTVGNIDSNVKFNSSSSSNSSRYLIGSGSAASSGNDAATIQIQGVTSSADTANTFSNLTLYLPNYAGSTAKSVSVDAVTENNATAAYAIFSAGLWNNTSAVTSITFTPASGSYAQYSTAYLYGISNS